jgi:TldD protein
MGDVGPPHAPDAPDAPDAAARAVLARLGREADLRYAEVRLVDERTERLRVRDGRPEQVVTGASLGVGIRVLAAKTWGFACTADLSERGLERAAREALRVARASARVTTRPVVFPPEPASVGTYETPLAIDPFAVPIEKKLGELERPVRLMLARGKPIQSAEAWMEWTRVYKRLWTTEGTDTTQNLTYGSAGMSVIARDDAGNTQRRSYPTCQGNDGFQGGYEHAEALDFPAHTEELCDEAIALLSAPRCPEGKRDLVLESSQVALQVHESCGHATELDRALGHEISLAGGSFLQPSLLGKLRYGSGCVDLVADATSPTGMGTFGWDDEGVPAGKHALVQEGMFTDYLSNRETAAALGRASTGTMRADGWNRTPLIRMVNVSLEPKKGTLDALLADTSDGVYMGCDKSWSIDDLRLNFQFSCEIAWEIKGGKKTRILRDPVYTGITPEFWRSCDAVCGPEEWRLWGITNCGKGDPMQVMQVGHGAAPARFRHVAQGSTGRT